MEVWVDVLGFVKRIQLARSVCFANWKIYEICWPRLHGDKVLAHPVQEIVIGYDGSGHPPTAHLLQGFRKLPFPDCSPPAYITGFGIIQIHCLDHQVFSLLALIAPRITTNKVRIVFLMKMSNLDETQLASVNQLLQLCRENITTIPSIHFHSCLSNIKFLPDVDNKMKIICCKGVEESDFPILMEFLASPRSDGQQRMMAVHFSRRQLPVAHKLLDAIKEEFHASNHPVPQPFCLKFIGANLNIPQSEEQNMQTEETLTIMPNLINIGLDICRHPRGQYEQWAEDARKRLALATDNNSITKILVDISEFGMPFSTA